MMPVEIYGNKGAHLIEMTAACIPVPKFVVITTSNLNYPELIDYDNIVKKIENDTGKRFGVDLKLSVRSSPPTVMPGMMETILNVSDYEQLRNAVKIVSDSLFNEKSIFYKKIFDIDEEMTTAIVIQEMVYGDYNNFNSGSGVFITRNPLNGSSDIPYGEFEFGIQGDKIVGGIDIPSQISIYSKTTNEQKCFEEVLPDCYKQLLNIGKYLERYYKDVQEIEFTVENGKLYILQTRNSMVNSSAECQIIVDFVNEEILTIEEASKRISVDQLTQFEYQDFDADENDLLSMGLNSSSGVACGKIIFYSPDIEIDEKEKYILVVKDTTPEMISLLKQCDGCLTQYGGSLCHAAIVCRGMKIPAVTCCKDLTIFNDHININGIDFFANDIISINGNNGKVYKGSQKIINKNFDNSIIKNILNYKQN